MKYQKAAMLSDEKNERTGEWKKTRTRTMIAVLMVSIMIHAANELMPIFSLECNGMARLYLSVPNG